MPQPVDRAVLINARGGMTLCSPLRGPVGAVFSLPDVGACESCVVARVGALG